MTGHPPREPQQHKAGTKAYVWGYNDTGERGPGRAARDFAPAPAALPAEDHRRDRWLLAALTSTMVLLVLDSSIVGVMLPDIISDFALTASQGAWLVSSYLLALAVFLPLGGKLSDTLGPRRCFVLGTAGFVASSALISLASTFALLVTGRTLAGLAAAVLMPATLSLLTANTAEDQRPAAMAVYTGVGQGFALIGPLIGGLCAQFLTWQWGFLINIPIGLLGIALIVWLRPTSPRRPVHSWDVRGLLLLVVGAGCTMIALIQAPSWGWTSLQVIITGTCSVAAIGAYVGLAQRTHDPILDLSLLHSRDFTANAILLATLGFAMTIATVYGAVALQHALHLEPAEAGLSLLPLVIPLLISTKLVAARYRRYGLRRVALGGSLTLSGGLLINAIGFAATSLPIVCLGLAFAGLGIGSIMSPLTTAAIGAVPTEQRGQASGLATASRQFGGVLGVAVFTAIIVAVPGEMGTAIGFAVAATTAAVAAVVTRRARPKVVR